MSWFLSITGAVLKRSTQTPPFIFFTLYKPQLPYRSTHYDQHRRICLLNIPTIDPSHITKLLSNVDVLKTSINTFFEEGV